MAGCARSKAKRLLRLEEQDSAVAEVEVDEVLRLWYKVRRYQPCQLKEKKYHA